MGVAQSSHHDVTAAVQGEVVGPGEGAIALSAAERFDPRVLTEVSGQLVGAGKAPGAALPGTVVGFLSWRKQETRGSIRREERMEGSNRRKRLSCFSELFKTFFQLLNSSQ